ncbi:MAG: 4Fe-4S dicluster domain-containing protein [Hyphomonadaceae bacterium]|nr:4Fe-4S dicluster domain-containing protein [Clostridia bacterium]
MSIRMHKENCVSCGKCQAVCPGSLLKSDAEGKTFIKYPKDCWGCTSCVKECAFDAIHYYLGADIGGKGHTLTIKQEGNLMHWLIQGKQQKTIITTDKTQANAY